MEKMKKFEAPGVEDEILKDQQRRDKILGKRGVEGLQKSDKSEINQLKKKFKIDSGALKL